MKFIPLFRPSSHVERTFRRLYYDYKQFELGTFLDHISIHTKRPLTARPFQLPPTVHGIWIPMPHKDIVVYDIHAQPVHQIHSILHEVAHIVLKHPVYSITQPGIMEILKRFGSTSGNAHLRWVSEPDYTEYEKEAEQFVYLIQRQVMKAQRIAELTQISSSIDALKQFTDASGYAD